MSDIGSINQFCPFSNKSNSEEQSAQQQAQANTAGQKRDARMIDPDYIPAFDELINS